MKHFKQLTILLAHICALSNLQTTLMITTKKIQNNVLYAIECKFTILRVCNF